MVSADKWEKKEAGRTDNKTRFAAVAKKEGMEHKVWRTTVAKDTWSGECLVPMLPVVSADHANYHHPSRPSPPVFLQLSFGGRSASESR